MNCVFILSVLPICHVSTYRVHLSYVATWSERLCEHFGTMSCTDRPFVVSYPQLTHEGVGPLLDFIYNGLFKLTHINFHSVLHAVVCLDVIPGVKLCLKYIEESDLDPTLLFSIIKMVDQYTFSKADTLLKTFLKHHINSAVLVSNFDSLKEEFVYELLNSSIISDRKELDVFRALMVWLHVNTPTLSTKKRLLSLLRFDEMSARDLEVVIASPPYLVDGCESVLLRAITHRHHAGHVPDRIHVPKHMT